jgi:hypothetical protein
MNREEIDRSAPAVSRPAPGVQAPEGPDPTRRFRRACCLQSHTPESERASDGQLARSAHRSCQGALRPRPGRVRRLCHRRRRSGPIDESEFFDARGDLPDLPSRMRPRIPCPWLELAGVPIDNLECSHGSPRRWRRRRVTCDLKANPNAAGRPPWSGCATREALRTAEKRRKR